MKITILILMILNSFLVGAVSAQQTKRPKKKTPALPTGKVIYQPDAEMLRDMETKVRVVESKRDWTKFDRQSPSVNLSKTRTAYIVQFKMENEPEAMLDVVVVYDKASDKFYEIRGIENFPWRPFSDFKWLSNDVLQFEQWVNPNNDGRNLVRRRRRGRGRR